MPEEIEVFKEKLRTLCERERSVGEQIGLGNELGSGSPFEKLDDMFDELVSMYKES